MFYALLDVIVCPSCKHDLTLLAPIEQSQKTTMRMKPALRASRLGAVVGPLPKTNVDTLLGNLLQPLATPPASDGRDREVSVVEGVLVCTSCQRWYPIRDSLPELLPDHLRNWSEDVAWLSSYHARLVANGLETVGRFLLEHSGPAGQLTQDEGAHYKQAEMALTQRNLPEGFFGPAQVAPFNPSRPDFSIDLVARYVTTVSRLGCGLGGAVFDLGVGYAWTTEWLVRLGYQAFGVDICRDYILAGLPRMGAHIPHLLVGDNENLPFRDECVDAVLSFDAFHHLPNRPQAMREFARIMRPGTTMVLVEPGIEHEAHPQSVAVMQQHGILERGFDRAGLAGYIQNTSLGQIQHYRSDTHPHDVYTVQKVGKFETDSLTPRALVAELAIRPTSSQMVAGAPIEIEAVLTNRGDTIWLNTAPNGIGEVHLGAQLFDPQHTLLAEDYARVLLPRAIRPNQSVRLQCQLPPILRPGNYLIEFDMVDNGYLWFKDYAYQPAQWSLVIVGALPSDGPLVAGSSTRITPLELPVESIVTSMISSHPEQVRTPAVPLLPLAWQVLKTEGIIAVSRKTVAYLQRRFLQK